MLNRSLRITLLLRQQPQRHQPQHRLQIQTQPLPKMSPPPIPSGFLPYTENDSTILLPSSTHRNPQAGSSIPTPKSDSTTTKDPDTMNTTSSSSSSSQTAFLNPVQEYNRDLSVAIIKEWSEVRLEEMKGKWEKGKERMVESWRRKEVKKAKRAQSIISKNPTPQSDDPSFDPSTILPESLNPPEKEKEWQFRPKKFTVIEALSATGLRSIRYAKELENVGLVLANDFSPSACEAMRRNVEYNEIGAVFWDQKSNNPTETGSSGGAGDEEGVQNDEHVDEEMEGEEEGGQGELKAKGKGKEVEENDQISSSKPSKRRRTIKKSGVVVNEGDACTLLYSHRGENDRVDVVDLDPYGTAAPFIDAAVQAVNDGGLLCVTCTDLAVMAGQNYPEKCFANYGGVPAKAEYTHEGALRLLLSTISTSAARHGRYIEPLLSLSIDFYVRVFVRIHSGALQVKDNFAQHGTVYICGFCSAFYPQPFGRIVDKQSKNGKDIRMHKFAAGPPVGPHCQHCGQSHHIAGPMWLGRLHNPEFLERVLKRLDTTDKELYKTSARMKGMMAVAKEELDELFFYTPGKMASSFRAVCPSLIDFTSALLNAGYLVSRSHCVAGSIKTNAPPSFVHDIMRELIKNKPVRRDKVPAGSPTMVLLDGEMRHEVSLAENKEAKKFTSRIDLVRYQANPAANWGPGMRAKTVKSTPLTATDHPRGGMTGVEEPEVDMDVAEVKEEEAASAAPKVQAEEDEEAMFNAVMSRCGDAPLSILGKREGGEIEGERPAKR